MIEITMPRLSDTMTQGAITTWHKHVGDRVEPGDILVEIETDKAVMDYEAYDTGVLTQILVEDGTPVEIGSPIALLDDGKPGVVEELPLGVTPAESAAGPGEVAEAPKEAAKAEAADGGNRAEHVPAPRSAPAPAPNPREQVNAVGVGGGVGPKERLLASPLVRKLAREHGIDLASIQGTGPGGRIIRVDIAHLLDEGKSAAGEQAAERGEAPTCSLEHRRAAVSSVARDGIGGGVSGRARGGGETGDLRDSGVVEPSAARQVIARRLAQSASEIPHFRVSMAVDVTALIAWRAQVNAQLAEVGATKISVNDLVVKAAAVALREYPDVNASWVDREGGPVILRHGRVNVGIAMAVERGLVVGVIRDVDTKSVTAVSAETRELGALAAAKGLSPEQMAGGTFTVSNLGMYGVDEFDAIINPPEAAILAVGAATPTPSVIGGGLDGGGEIGIRQIMRMTISADHRVVDGALAAKFLGAIRDALSRPQLLSLR
jgi:pyruvate dehydrogenase E2 component (dihydrolipoamide acetyltransferase)